jgi:hypothetical protein
VFGNYFIFVGVQAASQLPTHMPSIFSNPPTSNLQSFYL